MATEKKIVVIGGGTGTFTVLSGLKHYPECKLTAVVTMTDNGGSTGKLRDEFGYLPVGDIRQCLVALSREDQASEILRELFMYRFPESSSGLSGHNFGNLFLTVLTDILGSEVKAIEAVVDILNVRGQILPVTTDNVDLAAEYNNGSVLVGEKFIDNPNERHDKSARLTKLWTQPQAEAHAPTKEAIRAADYIIIGPGDLYASLLANVVVEGIPEAIQECKGEFIYIGNLVSKHGQTDGMTQSQYVREIEKYSGRLPDKIIINSAALPDDIVERYNAESSHPIQDDLATDTVLEPRTKRSDLLSEEIIQKDSGDVVKRSLLRHDSDKLADIIMDIINKN